MKDDSRNDQWVVNEGGLYPQQERYFEAVAAMRPGDKKIHKVIQRARASLAEANRIEPLASIIASQSGPGSGA